MYSQQMIQNYLPIECAPDKDTMSLSLNPIR